MMMNRMMQCTVVLIVAVVPVIQAQTDPCNDLSKEQCDQEEECTLFGFPSVCVSKIGKGSVARQGDDNRAYGSYCSIGGGQRNVAGGGAFDNESRDSSHSVVGGGQDNICFGKTNTIAGGKANFVSNGTNKSNTISGGHANNIQYSRFSVITGGGGDSSSGNRISSGDTNTISGGKQNRVNGSGNTVSGGDTNGYLSGTNSVITGGSANVAEGQGSVVVGGVGNSAKGDYSIALGENAKADKDHSMAVNLMQKGDELVTEQEGHFIMNADSFRFQIGNGKEKNGAIQVTLFTSENINNLNTAMAAE